MHDKKDNQITDTSKDLHMTSVFKNDSGFFVIHKKAEKIATATYLITNFFVSQEPLKWQLRNETSSLVKDSLALGSTSLSGQEVLVRELLSRLMHIDSLYTIAHTAGFVSTMNYTILQSEITKLARLIDTRAGSGASSQGLIFGNVFFDVGTLPKVAETRENQIIHNKYSVQPLVRQPMQAERQQTQAATKGSFIKDNQKDIKDKRKQLIIDTLKRNPSLTIKGFTDVIKDCSEKTIQRELLALVAEGVLKKAGERRWSTYSLA